MESPFGTIDQWHPLAHKEGDIMIGPQWVTFTEQNNPMPYKFFEEPKKQENLPPIAGELAIVNLPVKVLMEWSDKILVDEDYDNDGNPIPGSQRYRSGFLMKVLPNQVWVYNNEKRITYAQSMPEK
jgi:hypothetical protein